MNTGTNVSSVVEAWLLLLCLLSSASVLAANEQDTDTINSTNTALDVNKAAEASDDEPFVPSPSILSNVGTAVDSARDRVSNRFSGFIDQVDNYLGDESPTEEPNASWARVRVDTVQQNEEGVDLKGTVKLRVVLPKSQRRFRLLLSTEDDDASATNSDASQRESISTNNEGDVSLALRFIRTARDNAFVNYDLGARIRDDKAQVFVRINAAYQHDWRWGFKNRLSNNLLYFSSSGYENRIRYDMRRPLFNRDRFYFRNAAEIGWREGFKGASIGETIGVYAELSPRKAIALEAITGYNTSLNDGNTDRFPGVEARIRFRHSVWRSWFFYEIWPTVSWSASNDFKQAFGGLIRLEVTFGNI